MHAPLPMTRRMRVALLGASLLAPLVSGCGSSAAGSGASAVPAGPLLEKPASGSLFFQDAHRSGGARPRLTSVEWGRLVDVHDVDPVTGEPRLLPLFEDLVIQENVQNDGVNYRLEQNPVTLADRLVVLRTRGEPDHGNGTFEDLVRLATQNLPPVIPRGDDAFSPGPFSYVPRNATIVLTFDDLLDDGLDARKELNRLVHVLEGSPPSRIFEARLLFDPSHGGLLGDEFHSTRVLIDPTVSETELASSPVPLPLNALGLPASSPGTALPAASVRIPTRPDPDSGQFRVLRGLGGGSIDPRDGFPADLAAATRDVVRGFRPGNSVDTNNGFLLDLRRPRLLGTFQLDVRRAEQAPGGRPRVDLVLEVAFPTVCATRLRPGDIVSSGGEFLEVLLPTGPPDPSTGVLRDVRVETAGGVPLARLTDVLGLGELRTQFDSSLPVPPSCWVTFAPRPSTFPALDVQPDTQIALRFSEPMDPTSISAFSSLRVVSGDLAEPPTSVTSVVGTLAASPDAREFVFRSLLPLAHQVGESETYSVRLLSGPKGVRDLAGNSLAEALPDVPFQVDPDAASRDTAGILLTFEATDEHQVGFALGKDDLRGEFFYDLGRGLIRPRRFSRTSYPVDRNNPVPGLMIPFPKGVQTPLSPLGSKLQWVWRYCDPGWLVSDESKYDLDVEGLGWSPAGGAVLADFFERFEIRLSHGTKVPDEYIDPGLASPAFPSSGLWGRDRPFADNVLRQQVVVHNRDLGYEINPLDLAFTASGTPILPFPWNRAGGPRITYTWRDTSVFDQGGQYGTGVPLAVETEPPLQLYGPGAIAGSVARKDKVPTFGLPLLMEIRCFPSNRAIGLNAWDLSLATISSAVPNLRSYSTGGIDQNGVPIRKDPDLEVRPTGGFNPSSVPPGQPTAIVADNGLYTGRLDVVVRVSRVLTIWLDTEREDPDYVPELAEPLARDQPPGTRVVIEFRGANDFVNTQDRHLDAREIDPYGEPTRGQVRYAGGNDWKSSIEAVDGARYFQMRFTFVNDESEGQNAVLSGVGVAYEGS